MTLVDPSTIAWDLPFFTSDRPKPDRPVLVTGLRSCAMLNGAGELSLPRETRGALVDWGGVYAQGIRLTGPWRVELFAGGVRGELGRATLTSFAHDPGGVEALHAVGAVTVRDRIVPTETPPGVERELTLSSGTGGSADLELQVSLDPFLAPVLIEGVKPRTYRAERKRGLVTVRSHGFGLGVDTDPSPSEIRLGAEPWNGTDTEGALGPLGLRWGVRLPGGTPTSIRLRVFGGLESSLRERPSRRANLSMSPDSHRGRLKAWIDWCGATPEVGFPAVPELESGYRLARGALRMLYSAPAPGIEGLVAGYPWYSSLWGRDLAWMLPAVQWLGDADWVGRALSTAFRFQAAHRIPILGAEAGEIPMQLSPGPIFLYGTSDTTLYYPGLVRRFVDHTGTTDLARRWFPNLRRIVDWGSQKTPAGSALISNGGEVAVIRRETEVGRVHVGFDAVDTTIWDSTDRRDHAIDVEVLWAEALEAVGSLAADLGIDGPGVLAERADAVRKEIVNRYRWAEEGYLLDSLRADGEPVRKLRPNALRAVSAGLLPPDLARSLVLRVAREDLSTAWGVRTLSSLDPSYDPTAYHDGQVWTIATAWAADAALRGGERELGVRFLRTIADRLIEEGGYANECYRGDRAEAFDSCFLLGFSIAPFLTTLFSGLWGITPHMGRDSVEISPRFPEEWKDASISGLRLGPGHLSLDWKAPSLVARWEGPRPLRITAGTSSVDAVPGRSVMVPAPGPSKS